MIQNIYTHGVKIAIQQTKISWRKGSRIKIQKRHLSQTIPKYFLFEPMTHGLLVQSKTQGWNVNL